MTARGEQWSEKCRATARASGSVSCWARIESGPQHARSGDSARGSGSSPWSDKELSASGLSAIYFALLRELIDSDWSTLYGPLLGTLAVAHRPLSVPELARFARTDEPQVWNAIDALGQLLDEEADNFQLYHRSFAEFLLAGGSAARGYGLRAAEQHARIVAGYRAACWQADDDYGLRYLPAHLAALGDPALFEVINARFMRAKLRHFGSHQPFAADLELALDAALARIGLEAGGGGQGR